MRVKLYIDSYSMGAHIFGRLSILKSNLAKYPETCSNFPNLHHMIDMIDMIPYFKMLHIII